jgi:hypothetical protein
VIGKEVTIPNETFRRIDTACDPGWFPVTDSYTSTFSGSNDGSRFYDIIQSIAKTNTEVQGSMAGWELIVGNHTAGTIGFQLTVVCAKTEPVVVLR